MAQWDNVLLSNTNFAIRELGDNATCPVSVKLAALFCQMSSALASGAGEPFREGPQRQILSFTTRAENEARRFPVPCRRHQNNAIIQKEKTAGKFHAPPLCPMYSSSIRATQCRTSHVPRIEGIVIRRDRHAAGRNPIMSRKAS